MTAVILSGKAVMLHAAGIILSIIAVPQALTGIVLCRGAVRFERITVSFSAIGAL